MLMRKVQCRELSEFFYGCFIVSTGSGFRRLEASYVSTGIAAATKSHGEPASVVKNAAKPGFVWASSDTVGDVLAACRDPQIIFLVV